MPTADQKSQPKTLKQPSFAGTIVGWTSELSEGVSGFTSAQALSTATFLSPYCSESSARAGCIGGESSPQPKAKQVYRKSSFGGLRRDSASYVVVSDHLPRAVESRAAGGLSTDHPRFI